MASKYRVESAMPPLTSRVRDTSVAPYLTHIITHHGQVTLVPPQNQGRVRKNKKTRKSKFIQMERTTMNDVSATSLSSLYSAVTPHPKQKRNSEKIAMKTPSSITTPDTSPITTDAATRTDVTSADSRISEISPPPTYDSLHPESEISPVDDIISPSSQSGDGFENLTESDFDSEWELDRNAVRREWHRRQATVDGTNIESSCSILPPMPSSGRTSSESPTQRRPPKKSSGSTAGARCSTISPSILPKSIGPREISSGQLSHCSPHMPSKGVSRRDAKIQGDLTETLSDDWEPLGPHGMNAPQLPRPCGGTSTPNFAQRIDTHQTIDPRPTKARDNLSAGQDEVLKNTTIPSTESASVDHKDTIQSPPPKSKGKRREVRSDSSNVTSSAPAIHVQSLPVTPHSPECRHPVATTPSPSEEISLSSTLQALPNSRNSTTSLIPTRPDDCPPTTAPLATSPSSPESIRGRPLPPIPANFLSKAYAKHEPALPGASKRFPKRISPSLAALVNDEIKDGTNTQTSSRLSNAHDSDPLPLFIPECLDTHPSSIHSGPESRQRDPATVTMPLVSNDNNSHNPRARAQVPTHDRHSASLSGPHNSNQGSATVRRVNSAENVYREAGNSGPATSALHSSVADNPPHATTAAISGESEGGFGPYTDLDVLLSHLDDASNGNRYEDLLTVGELLGPAKPQSAPSSVLGDLPLGRVEVLRRRKLQDGRVKVKLSLLGVVVDGCGVCLSQFKNAEWAVLLPCIHSFHARCLKSWLFRSHTCPMCRATLVIS